MHAYPYMHESILLFSKHKNTLNVYTNTRFNICIKFCRSALISPTVLHICISKNYFAIVLLRLSALTCGSCVNLFY